MGGYFLTFFEDESEWEVDYKKCAMNDFIRAEGYPEFAPFPCLSDIALSQAKDWGLRRAQTLGEGCERCDFRFKKGRHTSITSKVAMLQKIS